MNVLSKLLVCAVFSLAAGLVYSQPGSADPLRPDRGLKSLGLTDDQVAQVTGVIDKARSSAQAQRASIGVLDAQIHQAMVAPSPDLKAVSALVDQKTVLVATLEKQKLAEEVQLRQILGDKTYDQARKFLTRSGKAAKNGKVGKLKKRPQP